MSDPSVLVVHCVDTEGPLGGNARRLPDGSPEFLDNWHDILASLGDLTSPEFRTHAADSFGDPYRFSWFVLDFTGFETNPKNRIAKYHDTLDNVRSLSVDADGVYLHHHVPPRSGIGDEWSDSWLSSNEVNIVVARRILERGEFPAAFRAGGTIEDNAASHWLEQVIPIDFSNRVSERSTSCADLYHFSWFGAPAIWGSYHPAHDDVMRVGSMRRFVYRSLDLRSRYNEITQAHVDEVFAQVGSSGESQVFSYFSHDNRDMREETEYIVRLLQSASSASGISWRNCTAVEAHQLLHGLEPQAIAIELEWDGDALMVATDAVPFQPSPFVAAELADGRFVRLFAVPVGPMVWRLPVRCAAVRRIGVAVTSVAGAVSLRTVAGAG